MCVWMEVVLEIGGGLMLCYGACWLWCGCGCVVNLVMFVVSCDEENMMKGEE